VKGFLWGTTGGVGEVKSVAWGVFLSGGGFSFCPGGGRKYKKKKNTLLFSLFCSPPLVRPFVFPPGGVLGWVGLEGKKEDVSEGGAKTREKKRPRGGGGGGAIGKPAPPPKPGSPGQGKKKMKTVIFFGGPKEGGVWGGKKKYKELRGPGGPVLKPPRKEPQALRTPPFVPLGEKLKKEEQRKERNTGVRLEFFGEGGPSPRILLYFDF